jgi:hypothetical protein
MIVIREVEPYLFHQKAPFAGKSQIIYNFKITKTIYTTILFNSVIKIENDSLNITDIIV